MTHGREDLRDHSLNSLLMTDSGLSRWEDGEPFQVILLMNDDQECVGLATTEDGRVLGWPHPAYGGDDAQELLDDVLTRSRPVPLDVDVAAKAWWANQSTTGL